MQKLCSDWRRGAAGRTRGPPRGIPSFALWWPLRASSIPEELVWQPLWPMPALSHLTGEKPTPAGTQGFYLCDHSQYLFGRNQVTFIVLCQRLPNLFWKGPDRKQILWGIWSVRILHLCCCSAKADRQYITKWAGCAPIKCYGNKFAFYIIFVCPQMYSYSLFKKKSKKYRSFWLWGCTRIDAMLNLANRP